MGFPSFMGFHRRFSTVIEVNLLFLNGGKSNARSTNPIIRFLFVALSFLIVNVWIYLIWHYLSRLIKSSRPVFSHLFTLKQMLEFLRQAVDRNYGVACEVYLT
jgi:putative transposase